ncbi:MAG: winged helix-turn-helix domain-containing protein [Candidatus Syntrophoarchaeum sp.]|nr:winged helix-turn-helix domain-containing protein [Candidatus Syntrophoarchaeum sp.]
MMEVGVVGEIPILMKQAKEKRDGVQSTLQLVACSALRRNLIINLSEGNKSLRDLREKLGISSTTAIHALRDLEKGNIVLQDEGRNYGLTRIGEIVASNLINFTNALDVLKKHESFWLEHDISGIPEHLLGKIGCLSDSIVVKADATDIFKVYSNFVDILQNAREVMGVSAMFVPDYPLIFQELLEKGVSVQLILTKKVLEKIDQKILKSLVENNSSKLELYVIEEDLKVAFTVTDYCLSFGLFSPDGTYDWNKDLISYDKEAIEWGKKLFEWYLKQTERV